MPRPRLDLAVAGGLALFLELALIRWLPAHVPFLAFFTNAVLLATFVGLSVGCLAADRPTRHLRRTPLFLLATVAAGLVVDHYRGKMIRAVDVGGQANPDVVFFGAEEVALRPLEFVVPVEVVLAAFFVLAAAVMIGPGQEVGRTFRRLPGRGTGYALNLIGSLLGVVAFAACSAAGLPPPVWFLAAAAGVAYLLLRPTGDAGPDPGLGWLPPLALAAGLTVATSGWVDGDRAARVVWSPYYRIDFTPSDAVVSTNGLGHQEIVPVGKVTGVPYPLPYLFQRDVPGWPPFRRVLVIGAGSGNDVARACQWCPPDARIDAVEIDPAILAIGRGEHPDRPYQDPRVTAHAADGRRFLRTAPDGEYDLVVFALVDSLVLQSGYGSLRLESYLFTAEAFADVRRVLKPTGVTAVYNFFRQGWIVARLRDETRRAFGADPVVVTFPQRAVVRADGLDPGFTVLLAGGEAAVRPLRDRLAADGYWAAVPGAAGPASAARFGGPPPADDDGVEAAVAALTGGGGAPRWVRLREAAVEDPGGLAPATDDWPFLYVRRPGVPGLTWRGVALTAALAAAVAAATLWPARRPPGDAARTPAAGWGPLARSFLLGAGFMLVEVKAVTETSLLFGSTWAVNTVVFAAVLVMALAGNRLAVWLRPRTLGPYYLGLGVALAAGWLVPTGALLGWTRAAQVGIAGVLAFAPVAFAGVIFADLIDRSPRPDLVYGANVAGALAGGLAENLSVAVGLHGLVLVAGAFYLGSAAVGRRSPSPSRQDVGYNADG